MCCVPVPMIHYITTVTQYGYELVLGTSWLGYELAWYDLVRVRVDQHPDVWVILSLSECFTECPSI